MQTALADSLRATQACLDTTVGAAQSRPWPTAARDHRMSEAGSKRRKGTKIAEHLKLALNVIDRQGSS